MDGITLLGLVAAALTTTAFVPQVIRVVRSHHTRDLSLVTFSILSAGIALWLVYGFMVSSLPVILANGVTLILTSVILIYKLKYG